MSEERAETKRPVVVLGVPCGPSVSFGFLQAITKALLDPEIDFRPCLVGNTVVHLARDQIIRATLAVEDADFLVMVDSDQVWHYGTIRRLVGWNVPVVAPLICQRNGEPIPVAYREVTQDAKGFWRYDPVIQEVAAYLRGFKPERWEASGAMVALLPMAQDHDPAITGLPDHLREGLSHPLHPVDALGTGMICFRRDVLDALRVDEKTGLYCDFQHGGEDFDLSRKVRAAGWLGVSDTPSGTPGQDKGLGLFVDRGALVGHLTQYSRGAADFLAFYSDWAHKNALAEREAADAQVDDPDDLGELPPASELVQQLRERNGQHGERPWADTRLPDELRAVEGAPV